MKILYITTIGATMTFFKTFVKNLISQGHTVDIASNISTSDIPKCYYEWGCKVYPLSCSRSPMSKMNLTAIKEIRQLVEKNEYDIVHCHTPIAAMCTRLGCRRMRNKGMKVFYTAHGFHFFKGAPKKNWIIFYPIEKICSYFTDVLVTINREDYEFARKKMGAKKVVYVPGVGIDTLKFTECNADKTEKRKELNISEDAIMLLSVGELNSNKNHECVIKALKISDNKNIHYCIAGKGDKEEYLTELSKEYDLQDRVHLLGFRTDIKELLDTTDIFCFPSFREGLPVSVMEAMASGMPCVVSKIRGNCDLIQEGQGGFLCNPSDSTQFAKAINKLLDNPDMMKKMGEFNKEYIKNFSLSEVQREMEKLYNEVLL